VRRTGDAAVGFVISESESSRRFDRGRRLRRGGISADHSSARPSHGYVSADPSDSARADDRERKIRGT
jgi:hypothetical protein